MLSSDSPGRHELWLPPGDSEVREGRSSAGALARLERLHGAGGPSSTEQKVSEHEPPESVEERGDEQLKKLGREKGTE